MHLVSAQPHIAQVAGPRPRARLDEDVAGEEQRQLVGLERVAALAYAGRRFDAEARQACKVGAAGTTEDATAASTVMAPVEGFEGLATVGALRKGAVGHPVWWL